MFHVVIVCGYDRFTDLPQYATAVADRLVGKAIDAVVVSGGFTAPGQHESEAGVIAAIIAERLPQTAVVAEDRAMTTIDNLVFGRQVAEILLGSRLRYTVFGDEVHAAKIAVLARILLGPGVDVQAIARRVPVVTRLFEPLSIVFEMIAAVIPPLRHALRFSAAWSKGVIAFSRNSVLRAFESAGGPPRLRFHNFGTEARPVPLTPSSKP